MSDEVEVEMAGLSSGEGQLGNVAAGFNEISQAGTASVMLTPVAFGILCSFFTPVANALQGVAMGAISSTAQGFDKTAQAVGACYTEYSQVDDQAAQRYTQLMGKI
ncbi:MAG TPA: hypothetical protein H9815_02010 [Candidatus Ruania gallistercoris]|uniref:Uncharacterized protein n=1 Tax=Candidatus Ruania gallistercoris TaxID=2838746 RepID=A0A9D2J3M9_9MICO|nr:hypothetical protein [Candidatus Ruania gallistercoris]